MSAIDNINVDEGSEPMNKSDVLRGPQMSRGSPALPQHTGVDSPYARVRALRMASRDPLSVSHSSHESSFAYSPDPGFLKSTSASGPASSNTENDNDNDSFSLVSGLNIHSQPRSHSGIHLQRSVGSSASLLNFSGGRRSRSREKETDRESINSSGDFTPRKAIFDSSLIHTSARSGSGALHFQDFLQAAEMGNGLNDSPEVRSSSTPRSRSGSMGTTTGPRVRNNSGDTAATLRKSYASRLFRYRESRVGVDDSNETASFTGTMSLISQGSSSPAPLSHQKDTSISDSAPKFRRRARSASTGHIFDSTVPTSWYGHMFNFENLHEQLLTAKNSADESLSNMLPEITKSIKLGRESGMTETQIKALETISSYAEQFVEIDADELIQTENAGLEACQELLYWDEAFSGDKKNANVVLNYLTKLLSIVSQCANIIVALDLKNTELAAEEERKLAGLGLDFPLSVRMESNNVDTILMERFKSDTDLRTIGDSKANAKPNGNVMKMKMKTATPSKSNQQHVRIADDDHVPDFKVLTTNANERLDPIMKIPSPEKFDSATRKIVGSESAGSLASDSAISNDNSSDAGIPEKTADEPTPTSMSRSQSLKRLVHHNPQHMRSWGSTDIRYHSPLSGIPRSTAHTQTSSISSLLASGKRTLRKSHTTHTFARKSTNAFRNGSDDDGADETKPKGFDDFEFIKPISRGGHGVIYLARDKENGEIVAVKCLPKMDVIRKNLLHGIVAEREIMANTYDSPFFVKFHHSFQTQFNLYIVMEFVPGGDLFSLLRMMTVFDEDSARQYVGETILALEYLHCRDCVHHDIKPDNLLVSRMGHIKLTDFGLSRIGLLSRQQEDQVFASDESGSELESDLSSSPSDVQSQSQSHHAQVHFENGEEQGSEDSDDEEFFISFGEQQARTSESSCNTPTRELGSMSVLNPSNIDTSTPPPNEPKASENTKDKDETRTAHGTPHYLAPEVILSWQQEGLDHCVDWWSVGVILYEFLFGSPPFDGNTPTEVFKSIVNDSLKFPPGAEETTSPEARDLITKLLAVNPTERLGVRGTDEVKQHPFFNGVDWATLHLTEPPFIPEPDDNLDTDYFEPRHEVYHLNHQDSVAELVSQEASTSTHPGLLSDVMKYDTKTRRRTASLADAMFPLDSSSSSAAGTPLQPRSRQPAHPKPKQQHSATNLLSHTHRPSPMSPQSKHLQHSNSLSMSGGHASRSRSSSRSRHRRQSSLDLVSARSPPPIQTAAVSSPLCRRPSSASSAGRQSLPGTPPIQRRNGSGTFSSPVGRRREFGSPSQPSQPSQPESASTKLLHRSPKVKHLPLGAGMRDCK